MGLIGGVDLITCPILVARSKRLARNIGLTRSSAALLLTLWQLSCSLTSGSFQYWSLTAPGIRICNAKYSCLRVYIFFKGKIAADLYSVLYHFAFTKMYGLLRPRFSFSFLKITKKFLTFLKSRNEKVKSIIRQFFNLIIPIVVDFIKSIVIENILQNAFDRKASISYGTQPL